MIRSKKENTTKTRKLEGRVPVTELKNLMRAMGYYPTNQEIMNMENEVRFSSFTTMGEPNTYVDRNTFIKLFVNHRPVYGIGKNNIEDAFKAIMADSDDTGLEGIHRDDLISMLCPKDTIGTGFGEEIPSDKLGELMQKLVSESDLQIALPDVVTSEVFAEDILGFEEVDENEGADEDDYEGGVVANPGATGVDNSKLGVIQEEP